ncbi:MAG: UDP-2,4-diacetamido-2,4,6-trideoxy-beta-L-altropyranose hydrolase, partial [Chloroflexi bacterium]|nr:UDP-2,4-diacetamido-2,4,6-trideoxy-beta-L-altropyranose hydrolase [Chloroflexota bacterium]
MSWPVAFRVDANSTMGAGHLMRCLSLAEACRAQGGEPVFFTATAAEGLVERVRTAGFGIVQIEPDAPDRGVRAICVWASANKRSWVVLDGYQFNGAYQLAVAQAGARLLVIDDHVRLPRYHSDLVLDQNLGSEGRRYPVSPRCRVLLGPRYALLAPGFTDAAVNARTHPERASRVLVTLGGADPDDATSLIISALNPAGSTDEFPNDLEVTVVIGAANRRRDEVREHAERSGFEVVENTTNMPGLMADADMAVIAAGSTSWEVCRMGLPTITITLADNQREIAAALADAGVAVSLGWHEGVTEDAVRREVLRLLDDRGERERMSETGRNLVDGRGAARVVKSGSVPGASRANACPAARLLLHQHHRGILRHGGSRRQVRRHDRDQRRPDDRGDQQRLAKRKVLGRDAHPDAD